MGKEGESKRYSRKKGTVEGGIKTKNYMYLVNQNFQGNLKRILKNNY